MGLNMPSSLVAERAVIAGVLLDNTQVNFFVSVLNDEDFTDPSLKKIYAAIETLYNNNIDVDVTSVADFLSNQHQLEDVGGIDFLITLTDNVVSTDIKPYINLIKDQTNLRAFSSLLAKTVDEFDTEASKDVSTYLDDFIEKATLISRNKHLDQFTKTSELIAELKKNILSPKNDAALGITTGYAYLDKKLAGGWKKEKLIVLAARTGVGKTTIGLNHAVAAAKKGHPVLYFSLEMSSSELINRIVSMTGHIENSKIQTGNIHSNEDLARIERAANTIQDLPIYFDDSPSISLNELIRKAYLFKENNKEIGLIVIDYMQLITVNSKSNLSEQEKIAEVSKKLKELARSLKCPIISICQLNRHAAINDAKQSSTKQEDKEPAITDIRGSGQIEQDADVILLLHRLKNDSLSMKQPQQEYRLLLKKNRDGETANINLCFTPRFCLFEALATSTEEENVDTSNN